MNLLEQVQQNLGYPTLQKIDLTNDNVVEDAQANEADKFGQAAIPAILTGLYKYAQTDEGATEILHATVKDDWIEKIFDTHKKDVIEKIAAYAKQSNENPKLKMESIADEAIMIINEQVGKDADLKKIKEFFNTQKNNILQYLLPTLNIGDLLNDNTLDDDTNKMEGPVSSLMHSLGNVFGSSTSKEDEIEKEKNL